MYRFRSNLPSNLSSFISKNSFRSHIWHQDQWLIDSDLDILAKELGLQGRYALIGNQTHHFQQMASSVKPCQVQIIEDHIRTRIFSRGVSREIKHKIDNLKTTIEVHTTNVENKNIASYNLFDQQKSIIGEYRAILATLGFSTQDIDNYMAILLEPHPDPYYKGVINKMQSLKTSIDKEQSHIKPPKHYHFLINTNAFEDRQNFLNEGNHWVRATITFDRDDPLKADFDYDDSVGTAPSKPLVDEVKKLFPPHRLKTTYSKEKKQKDGHNCGKYAMMSLFKKCQAIEGRIGQTYVQGDVKAIEASAANHRSPRRALRSQERPNPNLNFEFRNGYVASNPVYNDTYLAKPKRSSGHLDLKANESAMRVSKTLIEGFDSYNDQEKSSAIIDKILENINKAKAKLGPNHKAKDPKVINDFVMKVIEFAQQEGGVGNAGEAKWNDFTRKKPVPEGFTFDDAKQFSFHYQQAAKASGVYTGREENLKTGTLIGARLKRIPEDLNQFIETKLNQSVISSSLSR